MPVFLEIMQVFFMFHRKVKQGLVRYIFADVFQTFKFSNNHPYVLNVCSLCQDKNQKYSVADFLYIQDGARVKTGALIFNPGEMIRLQHMYNLFVIHSVHLLGL